TRSGTGICPFRSKTAAICWSSRGTSRSTLYAPGWSAIPRTGVGRATVPNWGWSAHRRGWKRDGYATSTGRPGPFAGSSPKAWRSREPNGHAAPTRPFLLPVGHRDRVGVHRAGDPGALQQRWLIGGCDGHVAVAA